MAKVGRPKGGSKITKAHKAAFVKNLRALGFMKISAELCGFSENAFRHHMEKDEEFAAEVRIAQSEWKRDQLDQIESPKWKLQHVDPETFTDRSKIDLNVQPITVKVADSRLIPNDGK